MESCEFPELDPVLAGWLHFRMGEYSTASSVSQGILDEFPDEKLPWATKLAATSEEARIVDEDLAEMTLGEELFAENEMQKDARPGTSLKTPTQSDSGAFNSNGPSVRPQTGSRPLTGYARPGTSNRPGTGQNRLDTGRLNTGNARPLTNQGRRLMTGQVTNPDGPFLNLSRLNLKHLAEDQNVARVLFEHLALVLGEFRECLNLIVSAAAHAPKDSFWKYAHALSCLRLGMVRKAEELATEFVRENSLPQGALLLAATYRRLDQPLAARQALKVGIEHNPDNLLLLANCARLEEQRGSIPESEKIYDKILTVDPINREALCVLAASKYYKDEPLQCLSFYRRALQTGEGCGALYNNLALASLATGQMDLGFRCFSKALQESTADDELEQIWYNIGNTCVAIGEFQLAQQAYRISVVLGDGSYALNNLGVLSAKSEKNEVKADTLFQQAIHAQSGWEAHWNSALISARRGDCQSTFHQAEAARELNPHEKRIGDMLRQLTNKFQLI